MSTCHSRHSLLSCRLKWGRTHTLTLIFHLHYLLHFHFTHKCLPYSLYEGTKQENHTFIYRLPENLYYATTQQDFSYFNLLAEQEIKTNPKKWFGSLRSSQIHALSFLIFKKLVTLNYMSCRDLCRSYGS